MELNIVEAAMRVAGHECDTIERPIKKDGTPITHIKIKTNTEENYYKLLRESFKIGDKKLTPIEYIDKDKMLIRCYNCNKIGHFQFTCKSKKRVID